MPATPLKIHRISKTDLTQEALARRLGCSTILVSLYERGVRIPPKARRQLLAKIYETDETELWPNILEEAQ